MAVVGASEIQRRTHRYHLCRIDRGLAEIVVSLDVIKIHPVLSGSGIAEIPSIVCGKHLTAGRLVELMPNWHFEPATISAVYSARLNFSRVVRLFKDFCVENIRMLVPDAKL